MSSSIRTSQRDHSGAAAGRRPVRSRRGLVAALAALATALGLAVPLALAAPATAAPGDPVWVSGGTGNVQTVSDGTSSAAQMTYNADNAGSGSWTFTATAQTSGTVKVPYSWVGLHAWFEVTARLDTVVNGAVLSTPVNDGPVDCCTSPSNGFDYGGVATFDVQAGDTYGFRLSGSNGDINNFLRGTFTLSTKPYLDATIGTDNRQWVGATTLPDGSGIDGTLTAAGETRWYRFPVVPGQQATVHLTNLPADYDVALYGDIGAAFDQLSSSTDLSQLAAASAQGAPGSATQVPDYPSQATDIPTSNVTPKFAPRIYAPSIYAPRIYAPDAYAPRIYAPTVYAPRIYAPDAYDPSLSADPGFSEAFSAAQDQTLLAVSSNTGTQDETVSASTGNTDGYFYVRVQGHTDLTPGGGFHVSQATTDTAGTQCAGLTDDSTIPLALVPPTDSADPTQQAPTAPDPTDPSTVIVTDTNRLDLTPFSDDYETYLSSLSSLASATNGTWLDVSQSPRVRALWDQVANHPSCPYAVNLVAAAIKQLTDGFRNSASKYVVIAGGDDVIPFFRYPDVSGLGPESEFSPPVLDNTPSGASLKSDQVQSQDAYGSDTNVTISGVTLPVPDLAVGRLVKTPAEIESTVDNYLGLDHGTLPTPHSSLVTGYDFLADAADAVNQQFSDALPGDTHDTLIDHPGVDDGTADNWNADQLSSALLGSHHDLVYLAGHFSANDTLAADFKTAFDAGELAPGGAHPDALKNTLVLSAGCHSGYNIVNSAAVPGSPTDPGTNTFDWTQRMAEQHAVLIGGTGYQYGDSDFLEYSERLYLDVSRRLHETTPNDAPVAVGAALVQGKQDYLSGLSTVSGIDQKAMLEATLYGLPMTGFDAPGRTAIDSDVSQSDPQPVGAGTPGATFGLKTDDLGVDTPTDTNTKDSGADPADNLPAQSTWLSGRDGVTVLPGAPAVPKQIEDVTVPGQVLRGVGFRSADYTDTTGILPVTGAPAIEGSTPNTTFESDAFFPQRLINANYFGTLGGSGRTSLILTPGQYRSDAGGALTDTQRAYSHMDMRLFYSGSTSQSFGQNQPSLAAAPSIGDVQGTVSNGVVTFSATVTGDPSAGVQQVWATWTGTGSDSGFGHWRSVDLTQDPNDSTHWTGTLTLPDGQSSSGMRFLMQAANGVGAVGLDTADGDGYRVFPAGVDNAALGLQTGPQTAASPLGVTATVTDPSGPVQGRTVRFTVSQGGSELFEYAAASGADGTVVLRLPPGQALPSGTVNVKADLIGDDGEPADSQQVSVQIVRTFTLDPGSGVALPASPYPTLKATLTNALGPVAGVPVTFTVPSTAPGAVFPGLKITATATTNAQGVATAPKLTSRLVVGTFQVTATAPGATTATVPMATQYLVSPFAAPISLIGTTVRSVSATTNLTALVLQPVQLVPDATAKALVAAQRVQLRWRLAGTTGPWTARTDLVTYDAKKHTFNASLVGTNLGWVKGKTYTVTFRILPGPNDVRPPGEDPVNGSFDLGSRSFTIRLT
jgi:hypothetical protein